MKINLIADIYLQNHYRAVYERLKTEKLHEKEVEDLLIQAHSCVLDLTKYSVWAGERLFYQKNRIMMEANPDF